MSVPTDNLYDFVHQVTEKRHWLVYFWPWGERDLACGHWYPHNFDIITDPVKGIPQSHIVATKFFPWSTIQQHPVLVKNFQSVLFCHDQEPLNWDHYLDASPYQQTLLQKVKKESGTDYPNQHIRLNIHNSWQKHWILLHSEINSRELEKYEQAGYKGAYWWSHALIARDWYRYAEHDPALDVDHPTQTFLIYCRDTTGSRSYRKDFLNLLDNDLLKHCQIGSIRSLPVSSNSSAEYDAFDFNSTAVSVVLETVVDRVHLTEKILRPIACGHPFILAAGAGSIKLLQHYGFHTFSPWIDESYDQESNIDRRLDMIVAEMKRLASHPNREHVMEQCRQIARYNQRRFFSAEFLDQITQELATNVKQAHANTDDLLDFDSYVQERRTKRKQNALGAPTPLQKELVSMARWARTHQGSFKQYKSHQGGLDNKSSTNGNDIE
jgi:hypothetical protein